MITFPSTFLSQNPGSFSGLYLSQSVRKTVTSYVGKSLKVRRSIDNLEQDIGFIGDELDEKDLLDFVGANDGFVSVWYDQSGNGYDAIQTVTSRQPKIVSSGVVEKSNGKPALFFDGIDDGFIAFSVQMDIYATWYIVGDFLSPNYFFINTNGYSARTGIYFYGQGNFPSKVRRGGSVINNDAVIDFAAGPPMVGTFNHGGGLLRVFKDNKVIGSKASALASETFTENLYIGFHYSSPTLLPSSGHFQEFSISSDITDQSMVDSRANINNYFTIF
jgi:hypothetical protein